MAASKNEDPIEKLFILKSELSQAYNPFILTQGIYLFINNIIIIPLA